MSLVLQAQVIVGIPFWGSDSDVEEDLFPDGSTWDTAYLAGLALPGTCEVKPTGIAGIEIDKKKPKGAHGAKITILGYDPRTFDVNCEIWRAKQWRDLQSVVAQVWLGPSAKVNDAQAISMRHPALLFMKVHSAIVIGLSPPVKGSFEGAKVVTFHMHEQVKTKGKIVKSPEAPVDTVPAFRNDQPPKNSALTPPGSDKNYTSPFPKADPLGGAS